MIVTKAARAYAAGVLGIFIIGCTTNPPATPTLPAPPTNTAMLLSPTPEPTHAPTLAADFDSQVPTAWFNLYLKLAQETPGYTPPVAARTFGYAAVTLYHSVLPG